MRDLLSFITGNLKKNRMTVDEFCKELGISRQKFYRFVKEPRRFSDDNIRSMIDILSLSDAETAQFGTYINPLQNWESSSGSADYGPMISGLFNRRLSEEFALNIPNIEYTSTTNTVSMESPRSFAAIVSCFGGSDAGFNALRQRASDISGTLLHEFDVTIYNCIPERAGSFPAITSEHEGACLTIASVIKNLDDMICAHSEVHIHVRHFLTGPQRKTLSQTDINDIDAMCDNLHILNTVLPLLSTAEDYAIEQSEPANRILTDTDNLCLIRHTCEVCPEEGSKPVSSGPDLTEYYVLIFNSNKTCSACRLGGIEASHIYRFMSVTPPGKDSMHRIQGYDPNAMFNLMDKQSRYILIHPDLCFDDIPTRMWRALYKEIMMRPERAFFESMFRKLIDPYGQYSFLSFTELVDAAVSTLDQRFGTGKDMGKIVICHPDGLADFVQNGIITDLLSKDFDYTGKGQNLVPLRFPPRMIRDLLTDLRAGILRRKDKNAGERISPDNTNYFILHPKFPYPEISYNIYKESLGLNALYTKGRHQHTIITCYPNPAVGTIIYDYVVKEMIDKRGEGLESAILSDDLSITLIDRLIAQLDGQIESTQTDDTSVQGDRS